MGAGLFETATSALGEQPALIVEHDLVESILSNPSFEARVGIYSEGGLPLHVTSLKVVYRDFSMLSHEELVAFLRRYGSDDVVKKLGEIVDLGALAAVLSFVEMCYGSFGRPQLSYLMDEETGEPFAAVIVVPDCDWEAWDVIAKHVKKEMREAGLGDIASEVAIVCLEGLQGPPR